MKFHWLMLIIFFACAEVVAQPGDYLTASEFLAIAFPSTTTETETETKTPTENEQVSPKFMADTLWLNAELKAVANSILGHDFQRLRVRYWRQGDRTAWVLDEIGKEKPITMGVVVDSNKISDVQVLSFRESRGGEIRHEFFTRQFTGLALIDNPNHQKPSLSGDVDGISGATMSVRAAKKMAALALYFHQQVMSSKALVAK